MQTYIYGELHLPVTTKLWKCANWTCIQQKRMQK